MVCPGLYIINKYWFFLRGKLPRFFVTSCYWQNTFLELKSDRPIFDYASRRGQWVAKSGKNVKSDQTNKTKKKVTPCCFRASSRYFLYIKLRRSHILGQHFFTVSLRLDGCKISTHLSLEIYKTAPQSQLISSLWRPTVMNPKEQIISFFIYLFPVLNSYFVKYLLSH